MKMRAKGREKMRLCGRRRRVQKEVWRLCRKGERPDAFSIMPLWFVSELGIVVNLSGVDLPVYYCDYWSYKCTGAGGGS